MYLMYDKEKNRKGQHRITVEDTLELLYIRIRDEVPKEMRRNRLDKEIKAIFG